MVGSLGKKTVQIFWLRIGLFFKDIKKSTVVLIPHL